jgi:hypothetical protein
MEYQYLLYSAITILIVMNNRKLLLFLNSLYDFKLKFTYAKERVVYRQHMAKIISYMNKGYGPYNKHFIVVKAITSSGADITVAINYIFSNISKFTVDLRNWLIEHKHPTDILYIRAIDKNNKIKVLVVDLIHNIELVSGEEIPFGCLESLLNEELVNNTDTSYPSYSHDLDLITENTLLKTR